MNNIVTSDDCTSPGLFGQKYSCRDYSNKNAWGKNQFNSSFPASLVAYMGSRNINPILLCTDKNNTLTHKYISAEELYGLNPCGEEAFYNYEGSFFPYEKYYIANTREKIDLVMINRNSEIATRGLEVKLTTLPDFTTSDCDEDKWGTEIVVRSPTILFLGCSICAVYDSAKGKSHLHELLNTIGTEIKDWGVIANVMPHYDAIERAILLVSKDISNKQTPLIMQPIWKTTTNMVDLATNCLDVFVWTNLAVIQMCLRDKNPKIDRISRNQRAIIWLYKMLWDFTLFGRFNYDDIVNDLAFLTKTDKAFAISGKLTNPMLRCNELLKPRITKYEIKNIILGNGWKFLQPERRFDAFLVNHPELFENL